MKRNVVLIDGTWNNEGVGFDTNVAKLDPAYGAAASPLIKGVANDGVRQLCLYHDGVGSDGPLLRKLLGGAIGLGLKSIIQDAYSWLAQNFEAGDEIYLIGFSRGAYAARALAGLIGASGIARGADKDAIEAKTRDEARKRLDFLDPHTMKVISSLDVLRSSGLPVAVTCG